MDLRRAKSPYGLTCVGLVVSLLGGCGGVPATPAAVPATASADQPAVAASTIRRDGSRLLLPVTIPQLATVASADPDPVGEAVRAYLRAFKLNEKDLPRGLSIPWGFFYDDALHGDGGTARVTGRTGPKGHEVYEVIRVSCASVSPTSCPGRFMEIAPEPEIAPGPPPTSPSVPAGFPAPTIRWP